MESPLLASYTFLYYFAFYEIIFLANWASIHPCVADLGRALDWKVPGEVSDILTLAPTNFLPCHPLSPDCWILSRREACNLWGFSAATGRVKEREGTRVLEFQSTRTEKKNTCSKISARDREQKMGYVMVISLPVILLFLIVAIACYLLGRARGR